MEPLLQLKAVIAKLAKSGTDLSYRADVKSNDEFGALADDFNHLLDRVCHIIDDLSSSLEKIDSVYLRLNKIGQQMEDRIKGVSERLGQGTRLLLGIGDETARLNQQGFEELENALMSLFELVSSSNMKPAVEKQVRVVIDDFRNVAVRASKIIDTGGQLIGVLADTSGQISDFSHFLEEMAVLEERMHGIAESGQLLIKRLTVEGH